MTREEFQTRLGQAPLFLDGATGSNLRAAGMPVGACAEMWVLEHPEAILSLQRRYVDAGSNVVFAPSFGGNRLNLARYGMQARVRELNRRLAELSQTAASGRAWVAGDVTTTGLRVDEDGGIGYAELMEIYAEQAQALFEAGVDLFVVETMMGVTECAAAIEGIRSVCELPILCSLTFDAIGDAYYDGNAELAAQSLPPLGADAVGINCGHGPDMCESVVRLMAGLTDVPILAKPNAGLPQMMEDGTAVYAMTPMKFAREMQKLKKAGARVLGGCCGTTPEHIRALVQVCGE